MIENPKVEVSLFEVFGKFSLSYIRQLFITQEAAIKSLRKYGVGSCGPRGFYGTIGKRIINL